MAPAFSYNGAMDEIWVGVEGIEDRYEVSNLGRVRALRPKNGRKPGHIMAPQNDKHGPSGRPHFTLWNGERYRTVRLAILVARAFLGPPPEGLEICHNDGDDWNCAVTNLRYDTHQSNIMDTVRQGTHQHTRKKTCKFGHPLDGVRTDWKTRKKTRYCKTCARERITLGIHAADRKTVTEA